MGFGHLEFGAIVRVAAMAGLRVFSVFGPFRIGL